MTDTLPDLAAMDGGAALFLDFDGVLVDFAPAPDLVRPEPFLVPTLETLQEKLDGALAIVTGRPLADIDRFLAPLVLPAAGQHGRELRVPGGEATEALPPPLDDEFAAVEAFVAEHPGTAAERKSGAVGIHYREAPQYRDEARALAERLLEGRDDLVLMSGKMIFELKERGVHKGLGVETMMALTPFEGRTPVFVGDDVTDEDGFRAAQAMGGIGIKVGEGDTEARVRVADLATFQDWLQAQALAKARGDAR